MKKVHYQSENLNPEPKTETLKPELPWKGPESKPHYQSQELNPEENKEALQVEYTFRSAAVKVALLYIDTERKFSSRAVAVLMLVQP